MKSVQIPYELFVDLVLYHLNGEEDFDEEIRHGLEQKLDAMLNRQLYSQYKTAPTEEQREQARQEYLDRRGVPQSYRCLLLLGSYDRSVPRSCKWQTRQSIGCRRPHRISRPHRKIRRFGDGWQRGFPKSSLPVGGGIEANSVAERLSFTPYFEDVGTTHKPRKTAKASAEAAYPLGERNALLMAPLSKVLLRYFWQK